MFDVGSDELKIIEINQAFQITGYLKNNSNHKWNISHDASIFTYVIYDGTGNIVQQDNEFLLKDDIAYWGELKPKSQYRNNGEEHRSKEYYTFRISKPGTYMIETRARFQIKNEEKFEKLELSSNRLTALIVK